MWGRQTCWRRDLGDRRSVEWVFIEALLSLERTLPVPLLLHISCRTLAANLFLLHLQWAWLLGGCGLVIHLLNSLHSLCSVSCDCLTGDSSLNLAVLPRVGKCIPFWGCHSNDDKWRKSKQEFCFHTVRTSGGWNQGVSAGAQHLQRPRTEPTCLLHFVMAPVCWLGLFNVRLPVFTWPLVWSTLLCFANNTHL